MKTSGVTCERVLDDVELCVLTCVPACQEVETREVGEAGGQDEWLLEAESRSGRTWVNWKGVRVFESDVWWK
jgi:hypothetical protein